MIEKSENWDINIETVALYGVCTCRPSRIRSTGAQVMATARATAMGLEINTQGMPVLELEHLTDMASCCWGGCVTEAKNLPGIHWLCVGTSQGTGHKLQGFSWSLLQCSADLLRPGKSKCWYTALRWLTLLVEMVGVVGVA